MDNKKRSFQNSNSMTKKSPSQDHHLIFQLNSQFHDHAFSAMDHHHDISASNLLPDISTWPNFPLPVTSQSSLRASSAHTSKAGDNQLAGGDNSSASSPDQSDDDDPEEIEAGPCEQSKKPLDTKRIKRMVSNRESARRSRRRKQEHVADLEQQAEQLRAENASLFKQLEDSTLHFKDSTTNNRVLRSNVDALRAKVKLAEDTVARGSLTSSLNNLLRNYLNAPPHDLLSNNNNNNNNMNNRINGISEESPVGLEDADAFFNSDAINHNIPEAWTNWETDHGGPVTKSPRTAYINYKDLGLGRNDGNYIIAMIRRGYSKASTYFKGNFKRLTKVKKKVDPGNFFRNGQGIPVLL